MASTAAAAASKTGRLSDLSDDILTHILSFAPSREAARATALSRRWRRPLWLNTSVVKVDYRSYSTGSRASVPLRRRVVDDADNAYACLCSSGQVPNKLSIVMRDDAIVCTACDEDDQDDSTVVEAADDADGVDDPRLEWLNNGGLPRCTLPFNVLRVLELTGYDLKPYSNRRQQLAFPRLEAIQLRRCRTELDTLQTIITAAPRLAHIRLEYLSFQHYEYVYSLSCPAATVIVMENLRHGRSTVTLNAPGLRRFRYAQTGFLDKNTTLPHLEELHFEVHSGSWDAAYLRRTILTNKNHLRYLNLTIYSIVDLANDYWQDFPNLERMEIEELCGWTARNHGAAAKAVVNLLRKCPILRELRLKFSWKKYLREINMDPADEMAAISDFSPCESITHYDDDEGHCCAGLEDLRKPRRPPRSSSPVLASPLWPPPLSEFPPLEALSCSSAREINEDDLSKAKEYIYPRYYVHSSDDDDDEEEEDNISPRHYMHSGRKKKKGGTPECFTVNPKAKGLIMSGWSRGRAIRRRYRHSDLKEGGGDDTGGSSLEAVSIPPPVASYATPAEAWSAPLISEFPLLRRAPPYPPWGAPLHHGPSSTTRRPLLASESPPLNHVTPPAPPSSINDTFPHEWRAVHLADLGVHEAASSRRSSHFARQRHSPPAALRHRFATFPGRPSRTMWRR